MSSFPPVRSPHSVLAHDLLPALTSRNAADAQAFADSLKKPEGEAKENVYMLKDGPGLVITDRVNGIMKIAFKGMLDGRPQYELMLNGKPLTLPSKPGPQAQNTLVGCQKISFEHHDGLVKITETSTHEYWIDGRLDAPRKTYKVYQFEPKVLTLEEASSKVRRLVLNHPAFKPQFIVYNRYGVAAFGDENKKCTFYWANPHQDEMHNIECSNIGEPGSFSALCYTRAEAADGSISFKQLLNMSATPPAWAYCLNDEPATEISLKEEGEKEIIENVYTLKEGPGLVVTDRLNGMMKVTFLGMRNGQPQYELMLKGKGLIFPTKGPVCFVNSLKITFERQDKLIKITEFDPNGKSEYWIDDSMQLDDKYILYMYQPKALTLEEAVSKVKKLALEHPAFNPEFTVFNRHGVAAYGYKGEKDKMEYSFYWANPHQDAMLKVAGNLSFPNYRGVASFQASDYSVQFQRDFVYTISAPSWGYSLNGEPAELIPQEPKKAARQDESEAKMDKEKKPDEKPKMVADAPAEKG